MEVADEWWREFFLSGQYRLDEHVADPERARREAEFIRERLALEPGAKVLDVCCGMGRHSNILAGLGYRVVGVDLTPNSLQAARAGEGAFVRGDMRRIPLRCRFDAAYNVFTSFGYFADEDDDQRVVDEVSRLLRPGGRFLIDLLNPINLARRFVTSMWSELPDGYLLQHNHWDLETGRSVCDWTFVRGTERHTIPTSVRLFTVPELARMFGIAGMRVVETFGNFLGDPLSLDTNRQIVVAEKLSD